MFFLQENDLSDMLETCQIMNGYILKLESQTQDTPLLDYLMLQTPQSTLASNNCPPSECAPFRTGHTPNQIGTCDRKHSLEFE